MMSIETEVLRGGAGDAEFVLLLRSGHSPSFAALMRRNNQRLYRLARGIVKDDAEAEEVVQEGYVRAFSNLDGFKGQSSIATWLARIVLNEALGRLRCRRRTIDIDEMAETLAAGVSAGAGLDDETSPERAIARGGIRRAIGRAVDRLPAAFRAVFMMRAIEQMSIEETAACLGIPGETVKTRLHRANKLLRQALSAEFGSILDDAFPFLGARCDGLIHRVLERLDLPPEPLAVPPRSHRPAAPQGSS